MPRQRVPRGRGGRAIDLAGGGFIRQMPVATARKRSCCRRAETTAHQPPPRVSKKRLSMTRARHAAEDASDTCDALCLMRTWQFAWTSCSIEVNSDRRFWHATGPNAERRRPRRRVKHERILPPPSGNSPAASRSLPWLGKQPAVAFNLCGVGDSAAEVPCRYRALRGRADAHHDRISNAPPMLRKS